MRIVFVLLVAAIASASAWFSDTFSRSLYALLEWKKPGRLRDRAGVLIAFLCVMTLWHGHVSAERQGLTGLSLFRPSDAFADQSDEPTARTSNMMPTRNLMSLGDPGVPPAGPASHLSNFSYVRLKASSAPASCVHWQSSNECSVSIGAVHDVWLGRHPHEADSQNQNLSRAHGTASHHRCKRCQLWPI